MRAEGRDGGEGADREPEEERWREVEMVMPGVCACLWESGGRDGEMEKMREMGSVMMKGRDDGMESKMGCGVRETSGGKRMEGDGVATGRRRGGESEEGEKKKGDRE